MANNSIYDKIIEKGNQEVQDILLQGEEKAKLITNQIIIETNNRVNDLIKEADNKNEDLIKTSLAEFEQTKKQKILANRKQIIKNIFNNTLEYLLKISDNDLKKIVISYIEKTNIKGNEVIQVNDKEYTRYQLLFSSKKNDKLDLLGKYLNRSEYNLTLSKERANIQGGFLIIGDYFDIDNSYETILKNLENDLETEVAKLLFESEE